MEMFVFRSQVETRWSVISMIFHEKEIVVVVMCTLLIDCYGVYANQVLSEISSIHACNLKIVM